MKRKKVRFFVRLLVLCLISIMLIAVMTSCGKDKKNAEKVKNLLYDGKYDEAKKLIDDSSKYDRKYFAGEMIKAEHYEAAYALLGEGYEYMTENVWQTVSGDLMPAYSKQRDAFVEAMIEQKHYDVALQCLIRSMSTSVNLPEEWFIKAYLGKYGNDISDLFFAEEGKSTVFFGSYEQDNDLTNGKEKIEWIVLKKGDVRDYHGASFLLLSKYALDIPTSKLMSWLNEEFMFTAFNMDEQAMMAEAGILWGQEDDSWELHNGGASYLFYKVFLPLPQWRERYLGGDVRCQATDYAIYSKNVKIDEDGNCNWCVYNADKSSFDIDLIHNKNVTYMPMFEYDEYGAVRPAIWIELK